MSEMKTYIKPPDGSIWSISDDPNKIQEAYAENPNDVIHAANIEDAIIQLNERRGFKSPITKFSETYQHGIEEKDYQFINSKCPLNIIVSFLKEQPGESFRVDGGWRINYFTQEWANAGLAKDREGLVRWDIQASKRYGKCKPGAYERRRKRKGDYTIDLLKELAYGMCYSVEALTGASRVRMTSYQDTDQIERGVLRMINAHRENNISFNAGQIHPGQDSTFIRAIRALVPYVNPPYYKEFENNSSTRISILNFVRQEAISVGLITKPKGLGENNDNSPK